MAETGYDKNEKNPNNLFELFRFFQKDGSYKKVRADKTGIEGDRTLFFSAESGVKGDPSKAQKITLKLTEAEVALMAVTLTGLFNQ